MLDTVKLKWTREPENYSIRPDRIEITTEPHTGYTTKENDKL
jgi:regulation of enolase protein 1 (concanavalin A-like superfamily)